MKSLLIHEEAELEFKEAVNYYESRSAGLGTDLAAQIEACFMSIRQNPARFSFHKKTSM